MPQATRAQLLVGKGWFQAAILVTLLGFAGLGWLAVRAYQASPPVPREVVGPDGEVVFTGDDVRAGQQLFLKKGLMEYGSVLGHGGYLGPDFTADYLRRAAESVRSSLATGGVGDAEDATQRMFRENRYEESTGRLRFTKEQIDAFRRATAHYREFFGTPKQPTGLIPDAIGNPDDVRQLTAFFAWTAWAAAANRPGEDYSYTNNWPPEPRVGNGPTAAMVLWSMLSLAALLGGIGILLTIYGRFSNELGWHGRQGASIAFRPPREVAVTPAQRACAWFFLVMAALFVVQALVGGASQHYRADLSSFFGIDLAKLFPFNLARTWHVQLAILWVATSYLAAGIFLVPAIAGHEPKGQRALSLVLLGALVVVVVGSLGGEFAGIHGWLDNTWFGNQGFEYLDLGRFWQIALTIGMLLWVAILFRGLRRRLRGEHVGNMPWLFFFAALAIPAFYAVGLLAETRDNFTVTDFWRFWVVHLWVEDFLEIFTTVAVAYMFVLLGVVTQRVALLVVYLHFILYSVGGVLGTMHHLYFSGTPVEHMALGAFFSAAEVIPLTFLTVEAWSFLRIGGGKNRGAGEPFPHRWAVMFLIAVGFWNFLGAGIFGFLINLPIVSYYEIGTALTANHGHAAMMGVYGMLAVSLALFALRYLVPPERWSDRLAKLSFWSLNGGLAWMVFATLFPLGIVQLHQAVSAGYYEARELGFLTRGTMTVLEWLRFPGDVVFIIGGAIPILVLAWRGVRHERSRPTLGASDPVVFATVEESEESRT